MKRANDIRDIVHDGVKQERAADRLSVSHVPNRGFTEFRKRKVVAMQAPMIKGAYARTVRIHELLHANRSPLTRPSKKWHPIAYNAIEDARVHSVFWPKHMPRKANRDCLATAMQDMRQIPPMSELGRAEDWNRALLIALRCMAIADHFRDMLGYWKRRQLFHRLQLRLLAAFGPLVVDKLVEILGKVRSRKTQAMREFQELLRIDETEEESQGNRKGKGSIGKTIEQPMRVVRLPMPEACNSAIRRTSLARSGARINRARLASAVVNGSTVGLFIRPRYLQGGTYLIDASGSMSLSNDRLNEICRKVPAATVAYYSGRGAITTDGFYGELVIYAERGKRAADVDRVWGGNEVDQFAIEWLLRQPAPRVFVSDGGFCGGPEGQDSRAAALLASAVANGQVVWHSTIGDLESALGS